MALFQVKTPGFGQRSFCAGLETDNKGTIILTAPILGWTLGKNLNEFRTYFAKKLWKIEEVECIQAIEPFSKSTGTRSA
jgi:hypothetical protein